MKSILISTKLAFNKTTNGTPCTPVYKRVWYHGFILFDKTSTNRFFSWHGGYCYHIFGFRFSVSYINETDLEVEKLKKSMVLS